MNWMRNPGRAAGFVYLSLVLTGPFNLIYVPNKLFATSDAAAIAANLAAHEALFRWSIAVGLIENFLFLFVGLALYRLLKDVDRTQAVLMVIFVAMTSVVGFVIEFDSLGALVVAHGADWLAAFSQQQRDALAVLFIKLRGQCIRADELFWGAWLFPLAVLVYRSRMIPRLIGIWLGVNGIAYVTVSLIGILTPQFAEMADKVAMPAQFGELALVLWLLIRGTRTAPERVLQTA